MKNNYIEPSIEVYSDLNELNKISNAPNCNQRIQELVGRVCYSSEHKITGNSYENFLKIAAKNSHRSIFEFGELKLKLKLKEYDIYNHINHIKTPYISVYQTMDSVIISGSPRAFIELLENMIKLKFVIEGLYISTCIMLKSLCPEMYFNWITYSDIESNLPSSYMIDDIEFKDVTSSSTYSSSENSKLLVKIICNRACSHEIVRHRIASYLQQSQRYVRIGDTLTICDTAERLEKLKEQDDYFTKVCELYNTELKNNPPQFARLYLPNAIATTLFMYCTKEEWRHFFRLRQSADADVTIRYVANNIYNQFINEKLI